MAYVNLPPNLQDMFGGLNSRLTRVEAKMNVGSLPSSAIFDTVKINTLLYTASTGGIAINDVDAYGYGLYSNADAYFVYNVGVQGTLTIGGSGNLQVNGNLTYPAATTGNAANAYITPVGGLMLRSTASSERYKENIVNLLSVPELDPKKLLDLPVRAFTYKEGELPESDDRYQQMIPGFIAEEVDAIYPIAADYVDGAESWNDRIIVPALLQLVQDLYKRVEELEAK